MKSKTVQTTWWLLALWLIGSGICLGQTTGTNAEPKRTSVSDGQVLLPDSGTWSGSTDASITGRPERPEAALLPQEVRQRLAEFEKLREQFLSRQRELVRKLQGASDEDREKIRETLRAQREAWLEQAKRFRDDARQRLQELRAQLPGHREALDAATDRRSDANRDGVRDRPRE